MEDVPGWTFACMPIFQFDQIPQQLIQHFRLFPMDPWRCKCDIITSTSERTRIMVYLMNTTDHGYMYKMVRWSLWLLLQTHRFCRHGSAAGPKRSWDTRSNLPTPGVYLDYLAGGEHSKGCTRLTLTTGTGISANSVMVHYPSPSLGELWNFQHLYKYTAEPNKQWYQYDFGSPIPDRDWCPYRGYPG